MLQFDRCHGCGLCIEVCPKEILDEGKTLNSRTQYPPIYKADSVCSFCRSCELVCPDFAIYVANITEEMKNE
ncbi:MAG: 4Fe-4S binding protein [Candidatus Helarchaeota archaeon]|nr:4Fe-4S binding protein [Candidatus Helarchaeota archaeon]